MVEAASSVEVSNKPVMEHGYLKQGWSTGGFSLSIGNLFGDLKGWIVVYLEGIEDLLSDKEDAVC